MCSSPSTPASLSATKKILGGLVFAKVRSGDQSFTGHVGDARATLFPGLTSSSSLVKNSLTASSSSTGAKHIEQLAQDFLTGRAEVRSRDYPKPASTAAFRLYAA